MNKLSHEDGNLIELLSRPVSCYIVLCLMLNQVKCKIMTRMSARSLSSCSKLAMTAELLLSCYRNLHDSACPFCTLLYRRLLIIMHL